jgi:FkbM family methyltransferase
VGLSHLIRAGFRRFGYDVVRAGPDGSVHANAGSLSSQLRFILSTLDIDCFIDVGAHAGEFGRFLRKLGYKGLIVSFEPVGHVFAKLEQEAKRDGNWLAYRLALGSERAMLPMRVASGTMLSSFLDTSDYGKHYYQENGDLIKVEEVPVVRLDDFLRDELPESRRRRVLKIDTQGYDLQVAAGAEGCMANVLALQTEVAVQQCYDGAPTYLDSIGYFTERGFELSGLFPVAFDWESLTVIEFDCLMVRTGAGVTASPASAGAVGA